MSRNLSTNILDTSKAESNSRRLWDKAIADAEEMIQEESAYVKRLKRSVQELTRLRDAGAVFPSVLLKYARLAGCTMEELVDDKIRWPS